MADIAAVAGTEVVAELFLAAAELFVVAAAWSAAAIAQSLEQVASLLEWAALTVVQTEPIEVAWPAAAAVFRMAPSAPSAPDRTGPGTSAGGSTPSYSCTATGM